MEFEEYTGKTIDEALTQAAIKFGTTSANIEYEVIDQGSNGVLGIGRRPAKINARVKEGYDLIENDIEDKKEEVKFEKREEKAEKVEKITKEKAIKEKVIKEKATKESALADSSVVDIAKDFLAKVFLAMNMEVNVNINFTEKDRNMDIELSGEEMGILIGKRGQTIDSLQYLVSLVVNKESKEYIRVKVDTENYRERRKATLEELAKNIAYKVKRTKRPVSLEPMNPYERRIIHSALQDDKYVTTKSEGEEPYRHVIVLLKK